MISFRGKRLKTILDLRRMKRRPGFLSWASDTTFLKRIGKILNTTFGLDFSRTSTQTR